MECINHEFIIENMFFRCLSCNKAEPIIIKNIHNCTCESTKYWFYNKSNNIYCENCKKIIKINKI